MNIRVPNRVRHSYRQHLLAAPARVFELLCPVRECDWIEGWAPQWVASHCGLAEPDCVFVTPGEPQPAIWVITRHDPAAGAIDMLKVTPGVTVCQLTIRLHADGAGCSADISYAHTSLGPQGDTLVERFDDAFYQAFMRDWETRLNHYLQSGSMLREVQRPG